MTRVAVKVARNVPGRGGTMTAGAILTAAWLTRALPDTWSRKVRQARARRASGAPRGG